MKNHALKIAVEDIRLLTDRNVTTVLVTADGGKYIEIGTFDKGAFDRWCLELKAANRPYTMLAASPLIGD